MTLQRSTSPLFSWLLLAVAMTPFSLAQTIRPSDDTVLKQVVLFGRHGVRSAAVPNSTLANFAARPYPDFGVPTGYLTPHGAAAETLLGSYFHDYLLSERLLTGDAKLDAKRSYFRANSIQRSNVSAEALSSALLPGIAPQVHSFPLGQVDPIFDPISAKVASVDTARAVTEVVGIFNNGAAIQSASAPEFSLVRSILLNYAPGIQPPPPPPAKVLDVTAQPIPLTAVSSNVATANVINTGGLITTLLAADPFVMEYTGGLPMQDVAWGQLTPETLSQQTRIITLDFAVTITPPYLDQVQSSNAASHVLRTLEQGVIDDVVPGAFGNAKSRLVVVNSSDAYVVGLAGLLHAHWLLPGYQPDYAAPGGNLVFELRQSRGTGEYVVRVYYTAQTFDQLRYLSPLTIDQPPATMQLLIPGGSKSETNLDVDFPIFERLLRKAIDPRAVQDPATELQPGVLTGVPLK